MLIILTGKSGAGKDTVLKELVNEYEFTPIVSVTSRPIRNGEKEGVDYNFITREDFFNRIENGSLLEYRKYDTKVGGVPDTWYYGSPNYLLEDDKDYVKVLDPTGARTFVEHYGADKCFVVYINTSDKLREERAKERGSFDKTEWDRRLANDNIQFHDFAENETNFDAMNGEYTSVDELAGNIWEAYAEYKQYIIKHGNKDNHRLFVNYESEYDTGTQFFKVYDLTALKEEEKYLEKLMKEERNKNTERE